MSLTGKIELEYEGELKGAEHVARELVRAAVATVFDGYAEYRGDCPSRLGLERAKLPSVRLCYDQGQGRHATAWRCAQSH